VRRRLQYYALLSGISGNIGNSFLPYEVAVTGTAATSVAYAQGVNGLGSGLVQVIASGAMDRSLWKAGWLLGSTLALGVLWMLVPVVRSSAALLALYTVIVLLAGLQTLSLQMVVGQESRPWAMGRDLSLIALLSGLGGLVAFSAAALITGHSRSVYLLYELAGALYLAAGACVFGLKEDGQVTRLYWQGDRWAAFAMKRFLEASAIFGFFWGFAWPLFTLTQARVIGMGYAEYSIAQLIALLSTMAFQPLAGIIVDRGVKKGLFLSRLGLAAFPLGFAFSTKAWHIYAINAATGLVSALVNISAGAYIYAASEHHSWARYLSRYNLINGVSSMAGSLSGGAVVDLLLQRLDLRTSLLLTYQIALLGRILASLLFLKLDEPRPRIP
jgi:hypothetical protein